MPPRVGLTLAFREWSCPCRFTVGAALSSEVRMCPCFQSDLQLGRACRALAVATRGVALLASGSRGFSLRDSGGGIIKCLKGEYTETFVDPLPSVPRLCCSGFRRMGKNDRVLAESVYFAGCASVHVRRCRATRGVHSMNPEGVSVSKGRGARMDGRLLLGSELCPWRDLENRKGKIESSKTITGR